MAFTPRVIADQIANEVVANQQSAANDYLAANLPPGQLASIPANSGAQSLGLLMQRIQEAAILEHVPGYCGTTPDDPSTVGKDFPVPSFIVQVDGSGAYVDLWWKKGPATTDWTTLGGGSTWPIIHVDPTAGLGLAKPIYTIVWQGTIAGVEPSEPVAAWIKTGMLDTDWEQLWPNSGGGGGLTITTDYDVDFSSLVSTGPLLNGAHTIDGHSWLVENNTNDAKTTLSIIASEGLHVGTNISDGTRTFDGAFRGSVVLTCPLTSFSSRLVETEFKEVWVWARIIRNSADGLSGGHNAGVRFGLETSGAPTNPFTRVNVIANPDSNPYSIPSTHLFAQGDVNIQGREWFVNAPALTGLSDGDPVHSADDVMVLRLAETSASFYTGVYSGGWPNRSSLTLRGKMEMSSFATGSSYFGTPAAKIGPCDGAHWNLMIGCQGLGCLNGIMSRLKIERLPLESSGGGGGGGGGGSGTATALATTGANVTVDTSAPPTAGQVLKATSPTSATWQDEEGGGSGTATALATTGANVVVNTASPPSAGQVLRATSATAADWETLSASSVGADPAGAAADVTTASIGAVPTTRTVAGHALSSNVTISAADVGAIATSAAGAANGVAQLDSSGLVPVAQLPALSAIDSTARTAAAAAQTTANAAVVANTAITPGTGTKVTYDGKGLVTGSTSATAADVGAVPTTRTVNSKALSANITLSASDVGADAAGAAAAITLSGLGGIPTTQKGAANGVATLDAGTLIPAAQLPGGTTSVAGALKIGTSAGTAYDGAAGAALASSVGSSTAQLAGILYPTGWPVDSTGAKLVTFSYSATTRKITITANVGSSFDIWSNGVKTTVSSPFVSAAHDATEGGWFFSFDGTNWAWSQTSWNLYSVRAVAFVYWSSVGTTGTAFYECHWERDLGWHLNHHGSDGTVLLSGGTLGNYALNTGTDGSIQFSIASTVIMDEDLQYTLAAKAAGAGFTVWTRSGASGYWQWATGQSLPFLYGTYPQRNYFNGATWTMADINGSGGGNYGTFYVIATPAIDSTHRFIIIPGQTQYSSASAAQGETFSSLSLGTLPFQEFVPIAQVVFQARHTFGGTASAEFISVTALTGPRGSVTSSAGPFAHNALSGIQGGAVGDYQHITSAQVTAFIQAGTDATSALAEIASIAPGGTISQWNHGIEFSGASDVNTTSTPKVGKTAKVDINIYVGYTTFTLRTVAYVANSGSTGYVYLYNITDAETVGTPIAVTATVPTEYTFAFSVGSSAGNMKNTSGGKIYEGRYYISSPGASDLIVVGSIELRVT